MRSRRSSCAILLVCCFLAVPALSRADDEPAVRNQLYDHSGRFEVMLAPSMSIFDKYTRHVGVSLGMAYFFNDYIGLEFDAGYNFISGDRKLLNEILRTATSLDGVEKLPLTDLKHMTWSTTLGIIFSPLYGKLNFSSEFAVSIHLYFIGGAGVAQYEYSELDHDPATADPQFDPNVFRKVKKTYNGGMLDSAVQPVFHFGGGLRFHFLEDWNIKIEIRDVFFYDDYHAEWNETGSGVTDKPITDFVHTTFLRLGVGWAF
ncbi:MAG: outer membrane beta-barrel domain-containing protein [Deltaproteobacteria bacterium]|nr:outer membrane beta-barrel domain-containing protein [Deltaproteobacteria bacterium]